MPKRKKGKAKAQGSKPTARRGSPTIPNGLNSDFRRLAEAMKENDWYFERARHIKAFAPDGRTWITLPTTPSDRHAYPNARGDYRRWCDANGKPRNI